MTSTQEKAPSFKMVGIISFPHLFTPWASAKDLADRKAPKYSATLLIDAAGQATSEFAALKAEANRVALTRYTAEEIQALLPEGLFKTPFINGDRLAAKNPECAGKIVLRLSSKVKPGVVDQQVRPIEDETKIYPGCKVLVSMNAYAYGPTRENPQIAKGVAFGLRNVQLIDGTLPRLDNSTRPEDDFVPLAEAAAAGGANPSSMF